MTPSPTTKPFRVHLAVVGIAAVTAAVGIAGIAAYYAVPGNSGAAHGAERRAAGAAASGAEDTPRSDAPRSVKRLEAQHKAMNALFTLARNREAMGLTTPLTKEDTQGVNVAVDAVGEPAADPNDRAGLFWMFARNCEGYRFVVADGSYAPVFDAAFWEAVGRLAKEPGPAPGTFLTELNRRLTDPQARKRMDALRQAQRAIKPSKPAPELPGPSSARGATPTRK